MLTFKQYEQKQKLQLRKCTGMQPCIPDHFQNLIKKVGEEEQDGNPLTDSPEVVPSISVAARVVQFGSSSNEQGQSKEQHTPQRND